MFTIDRYYNAQHIMQLIRKYKSDYYSNAIDIIT